MCPTILDNKKTYLSKKWIFDDKNVIIVCVVERKLNEWIKLFRNTLYNVCAVPETPCITCVQYHGGGGGGSRGFSIVGGYHDACGGYLEYHGGYHDKCGDILSTVGLFSTVGNIMSTIGDCLEYHAWGIFSTVRGYHDARGGYHQYRGVLK